MSFFWRRGGGGGGGGGGGALNPPFFLYLIYNLLPQAHLNNGPEFYKLIYKEGAYFIFIFCLEGESQFRRTLHVNAVYIVYTCFPFLLLCYVVVFVFI